MTQLTAAKNRLKSISKELNDAFPERRNLVRGTLTALLAEEHVLILGPPGTAKSAFTRELSMAVCGGKTDSFFEVLLTKFTTVEEVYGPISFSALKQDSYKRILDGYAATKKIWFFDEIFKASSAILNCNLTAMNERKFHNGGAPVSIPLEMLIAASNEYPQDESLKALFDRFSFKFWVDYIGDRDAIARLLSHGGVKKVITRLETGDLEELRNATDAIVFDAALVEKMLTIKDSVEKEGFVCSDRSWVKSVRIIKARAILSGRSKIISSDFLALADVLWQEHKDRDKLRTVIGNAADPYSARAEALTDAIRTAMNGLPALSTIKTGSKTKVEVMKELADISGQVESRKKAAIDSLKEAPDNDALKEAREIAEDAIKQITVTMTDALNYKEIKE